MVDVATGTVAQRMDYDAFGNVLQDTSPGFQPFGFAGGLYDPDAKLVRFASGVEQAYERWCYYVRTNKEHGVAVKQLTKTGNSLAVILDRPLLEQTGIDETTPLEISTDGDVIVISPVRDAKARRRLRKAVDEIHGLYAGVFRRLAE